VLAESQILYLFSSNQSRLYEQDILDVLAAPAGTLRQFRYFERYVSQTFRANVSELEGKVALLHFSLQQEEQYHEPVVIPVRWATVHSAALVGDVYAIQLRMDKWCSLRVPRKDDGAPTFGDWEQKRDIVRRYQQLLADHNVERPYSSSAGIGKDIRDGHTPLEPTADDALLFNYSAQYLQSTRSFHSARFYRVRAIRDLTDRGDAAEISAGDDGTFQLRGGRTYSLQLSHFQPQNPQGIDRIRREADGKSVLPIGKPHFEIASRYDDAAIEFHAAEPPTSEARDSVIILEPDGGTFAAKVRLRLRVVRPVSKTATSVGGAALVAILLGIPTLWTTLEPTWKVLSVVSAALITALLANAGLRRP
jgi:hypothetical protein